MKKVLLAMTVIVSTSNAFAWTEIVQCKVQRKNVDFQTITEGTISDAIKMGSAQGGEQGFVELKSSLIPSYKVVLSMVSGGRSDTLTMQSSLGNQLMALSSIDGQLSNAKNPIVNKFVTDNGDYEITISCTTSSTLN